MADYALIGGRSPLYREDFTLEEKIFANLSLEPKQILFIPFANQNIEEAIQKFKALVPKKFKVQYLTSLENAEEAFESSDVIYFGGGNAEHLVSFVQSTIVLDLILKYKERSKLFMGISAGAILFSVAGMGDQYSYKNGMHFYNYQMVMGLDILPITICPHYDHDGLDCYNTEVKKYSLDGFALEDDTAILINSHIQVFKMNPKKSVYMFHYDENYLMHALYEEPKKSLSVLGPKGTYSDLARKKLSRTYPVVYYPSIFTVCNQVTKTMDAFIPLENTLDGFVMESLDSIIKYNLYITEQVKLKVNFQFASYEKNMAEIHEVYVQFKAYGQCQNFIIQHNLTPIFTQSNMESLNCLLKKERSSVGAILPDHVAIDSFPLIQKNILGNVLDETRFVLATKKPFVLGFASKFTCSLTVTPKEDKSGQLFNILKKFHEQGFNLKAILSRPKKDYIGNYIFYIEFDLTKEELPKLYKLKQKIEEQEQCSVNILGIYNVI
ncbi:MAG: type 1 glutamine amidotransferase-like domain-containing protein [Acholeplasmatales bacterium]|jgi:prephenate dehydratase|nr:type 1 glutamine amidotransferase-like domain-containing protein [Acholeplasmatales bacterium]